MAKLSLWHFFTRRTSVKKLACVDRSAVSVGWCKAAGVPQFSLTLVLPEESPSRHFVVELTEAEASDVVAFWSARLRRDA